MTGQRGLRIERISGVVGLLATAGSLIAAWIRPDRDAPSYLPAFMVFLNLSLGAWALLMIHDLVGGEWGDAIRPALRASAALIPAMALLFLPVLFGLRHLYPWAGDVGGTPAHLHGWLNPAAFILRSAIYFTGWSLVSRLLLRGKHPRQGFSAGGLVLYVFTLFFASVDWLLSIEPAWSSSIYGLLTVADQGVSAMALGTLVYLWRSPRPKPEVLNDLGNLLLTTVLLWTYLSFSQYLIIWSENLPRETSWVARRTQSGWRAVAQGLILLHFAVPLLLLLQRRVKTRPVWLGSIAAGLLLLRVVDTGWRILPAYDAHGFVFRASMLAAPLGVGGLWTALFLGSLRRSTEAPAP